MIVAGDNGEVFLARWGEACESGMCFERVCVLPFAEHSYFRGAAVACGPAEFDS